MIRKGGAIVDFFINKLEMVRIGKENYYLNIANSVLERGTCLSRNFGAVIVKNDQVISSGYTGAPRGCKNCIDLQTCVREELHIPKGERYELCRSVHAEANAIIHAARKDMLGSTLYLVGVDAKTGEYVENTSSCSMCKRLIINAGIEKVVIRKNIDDYEVINVRDWVENDDFLLKNIGSNKY